MPIVNDTLPSDDDVQRICRDCKRKSESGCTSLERNPASKAADASRTALYELLMDYQLLDPRTRDEAIRQACEINRGLTTGLLHRLVEVVSEMQIPRCKAVVGQNAFVQEAGIHRSEISKPKTHSCFTPSIFHHE